jgi:hypothetical protein
LFYVSGLLTLRAFFGPSSCVLGPDTAMCGHPGMCYMLPFLVVSLPVINVLACMFVLLFSFVKILSQFKYILFDEIDRYEV